MGTAPGGSCITRLRDAPGAVFAAAVLLTVTAPQSSWIAIDLARVSLSTGQSARGRWNAKRKIAADVTKALVSPNGVSQSGLGVGKHSVISRGPRGSTSAPRGKRLIVVRAIRDYELLLGGIVS